MWQKVRFGPWTGLEGILESNKAMTFMYTSPHLMKHNKPVTRTPADPRNVTAFVWWCFLEESWELWVFYVVPSRFTKQLSAGVGWGVENISVFVIKGPCHLRLSLINSLNESLWVIPLSRCSPEEHIMSFQTGQRSLAKPSTNVREARKDKLLKWICVPMHYRLHFIWSPGTERALKGPLRRKP